MKQEFGRHLSDKEHLFDDEGNPISAIPKEPAPNTMVKDEGGVREFDNELPKPVVSIMDVNDIKKLLAEQEEERSRACMREIEAVLKKYSRKLIPKFVIMGNSIVSNSVVLVSETEKTE